MFEKTIELWDKPKMLWTIQDKFDFICETWWIWIIIIILAFITVITISTAIAPLINKIFDWLEKHDMF